MMKEPTTHAVLVGCQGWNYADWVGPFYPRGTRAAEMLNLYARAFDTVEVDSTFYAVPSGSTVENWARRAPSGFTFSLKLPQEVTHQGALRGEIAAAVLSEFCARARLLGEKLACVLVQLPPQFMCAPENMRALREFLPLLPRDVRFSVEFRDPLWFEEGVVEVLDRHGVAPALVEGPWVRRERVWQLAEASRADFAYVRWMGERDLTRFDAVQRARDENLRAWAACLSRLARPVYAYFSNFYEGHAPASANKLMRALGQRAVAPEELADQPSLF